MTLALAGLLGRAGHKVPGGIARHGIEEDLRGTFNGAKVDEPRRTPRLRSPVWLFVRIINPPTPGPRAAPTASSRFRSRRCAARYRVPSGGFVAH